MKVSVDPREGSIQVLELKDGEIAVITDWAMHGSKYNGMVLQRYGDALIKIGAGARYGWATAFQGTVFENEGFRVRRLQPGESIRLN